MGIFGFGKKSALPTPEQALAGRDEVMRVTAQHYVNKNPLQAPFPQDLETAMFGLGCFWGAERKFWQQEGVYTTAEVMRLVTHPTPPIKKSVAV
jgi:peptide-methionine (S)-S-oxide reductase